MIRQFSLMNVLRWDTLTASTSWTVEAIDLGIQKTQMCIDAIAPGNVEIKPCVAPVGIDASKIGDQAERLELIIHRIAHPAAVVRDSNLNGYRSVHKIIFNFTTLSVWLYSSFIKLIRVGCGKSKRWNKAAQSDKCDGENVDRAHVGWVSFIYSRVDGLRRDMRACKNIQSGRLDGSSRMYCLSVFAKGEACHYSRFVRVMLYLIFSYAPHLAMEPTGF